MKALVGTFNQEKALVGASSVIVKTDCGTDGSFYSTTNVILLFIWPHFRLNHNIISQKYSVFCTNTFDGEILNADVMV